MRWSPASIQRSNWTIESSPFLTSVSRVEVVEALEFLEPVAVLRDREGLAHHREEIDEHLSAKQVVDLVFARRMFLGQAAKRRLLVVRVVIHVQRGKTAAPLHHEVDELLEGTLLFGAVEPPKGAKRRIVVGHPAAEEIFQAAARLVERVALHIEEDVAG